LGNINGWPNDLARIINSGAARKKRNAVAKMGGIE
jgi:hypothetical protein